MRVTISTAELLGLIQTVVDAVPSKSTLPILSNLLVVAEDGRCRLAATDLDLSVATEIPLAIDKPGRATVPARKMFEIVRALPDGMLTLSETDGRITLRSDTGEYSLLGMPADEFPTLQEGLEGTAVKIDGALLNRMMKKTAFAVCPDDTKPALVGVHWTVKAGETVMVATDGHRLARISESLDGADDLPEVKAIVPRRALAQFEKLLTDERPLQHVTIGERQVWFHFTGADLYARLIDATYPDVETVIPDNNDQHLRISSNLLIPAAHRMDVLSSSQNHQVRVSLRPNSVELSTLNRETGAEAHEAVEADYAGDETDIGYNGNYMLEILSKIDSDEVAVEFKEPVSPAIVRPVDQPEGEDYFCLLMPLLLRDS